VGLTIFAYELTMAHPGVPSLGDPFDSYLVQPQQLNGIVPDTQPLLHRWQKVQTFFAEVNQTLLDLNLANHRFQYGQDNEFRLLMEIVCQHIPDAYDLHHHLDEGIELAYRLTPIPDSEARVYDESIRQLRRRLEERSRVYKSQIHLS